MDAGEYDEYHVIINKIQIHFTIKDSEMPFDFFY